MLSSLGAWSASAVAVSSNPWGAPPALCISSTHQQTQQHYQQQQGRQQKRSQQPSCQAGRHGVWSSDRVVRQVAQRMPGVHATTYPRSTVGPSFTTLCNATSSSASSSSSPSNTGLLPFPDLPDLQQELLCDVLRIKPSDAQLLLLSCQALSTITRAELTQGWAQLQQLLPVPNSMLLQAMLQLPGLLLQPKQTVAARLAESARVLGLPVSRLKAKRRGQTPHLHWRLLVTPVEQLEQQMLQLTQLLPGLKPQLLVQLVCAESRLLHIDPAQLLSTVEALEQVCGCPLARLALHLQQEPRLLVTPAEGLYQAAKGLQQLLRLSEEGLTLVVRRAPAALLVPPARLLDLLSSMSAALVVAPEVAADVLLQEPELLVRGPGAILAVMTFLRSWYTLNADALLQVVQFDPSILFLSAGQLAEEAKQFRRLSAKHPGWWAEYKFLMSKPVNVARALRIEPLRLQRLVYLSAQGYAGTISLRNALTLSGRKFVLLYPQYPAWLARTYSKGNAPKRYAAVGPVEAYDEDSDDDRDY